jgi:hypothetical protein
MTIPVKIEMGGSVLFAQMHAVPRVGEKLRTAFPAVGFDEKLHLVVTDVIHHQVGTPEAREDREPFAIIVTVEGDPAQKRLNDAVMLKAARGSGNA